MLEDGRFVQREHLAELAERFEMSLRDSIVGLIAVSISVWPILCEIVCERVEATAIFDQSGDIYLGADEVANRASIVVERRCEKEVHEWCTISPVVEKRFARLLSRFDCCANSGDGCSV